MLTKICTSVTTLLLLLVYSTAQAACPVVPGSITTSDAIICSGTSPGKIEATASSDGNGILFYIWQRSTNSGASWSVIVGSNSEDHTPGNLITSTWYKRSTVDLGGCATQETGIVKFTVTPVTNITVSASNSEVCDGDNATFSITATGSGLSYQWQENDGGGFANLANGGIYSNVTSATLNLTGVSTTEDGYRYRCVVSSTACTNSTSSAKTLTVLAKPVVTVSPSSTTQCVDGDPTFSVTATGDNLTYQWQEDDGGGFADIVNGGIYSDASTATLTLTNVIFAMDGYKYRCEVDNSACLSVQSASATLTVEQAPVISVNPANTAVCVDGDPVFSVTASGTAISYQWQESTGGAFNNLANAGVYSGTSTATLTITDATAGMNGHDYRCIVDNSSCVAATSSSANLEVNTAPTVTTDPSSVTVCADDDPNFSVVATGSGLTYQWQEDDGGGFNNLANGGVYSGALTASLSITDVTVGMSGYDYQCVVSGTCTPNDISAAATMTVLAAPNVTVDPSDDAACDGDNASFSVTATGTAISYQWQENDGGGFSDIADGGVYGGVSTATLSLTGVTTGMNGYDYRCEVTNSDCPLDQSASAELTVETSPTVTSNPSAQLVCPDDDPTFSVVATGSNLTYRWQVDEGSGYGNISNGGVYSNATTATLNITDVTAGMDGFLYRCRVSGSCTPNVNSTGALLTVRAVPVVTTNPSGTTVCVDDDPTFSVVATGIGLTYQWQEDDGGGFSNIANGGVYSDATTATLTLTDVTASMSTYDYRCVVSGTCSPVATSASATLTVDQPVTFTLQPGSTNYCTGDDVTLKVTLSGTVGTVQWREDDGGGFANLSNNATYSDVTTQAVTISSVPVGFDGYKYQCIVSNTGCGSSISNSAELTNTAAPSVTTNPSNSIVCENDDPTFTIAATGANLAYQWQVDAGGGFGDLSANATYSGVNTNSLSITDASTVLDGNDYRCVVSSATCPTATSSSASLTVNLLPAVTVDPTGEDKCESDNVTFSVTATGTSLTYQWQEDQGTGFGNLSNGGKYSNVTTATMGIASVTTAFNGYEYRCVVSGTCTPAQTSASAELTVVSSVAILTQPSAATVCVDDDPTFSVSAFGGTITYQWQEDDGGGFANLANGGVYSDVTTNTLSLTNVTAAMTGYDYRCIVSSTCGGPVTSNAVDMEVDVAPAVTVNPSNQAECESDGASFGVTATGTNLTYQWQEDDGGGFANIANGGIYGGATTTSLSISAVAASMDGYDYRCQVSNAGCGATLSSSANLGVTPSPAITANGGNETTCEAGNATFTIAATGAGLTYQWQEDDGGGFANLANGGAYSGATSNSLTVSGVTSTMDEYVYRCVVSGTCNPSATGINDTLFVSLQPTVTADPSDDVICESNNVTFSVTATGSNLTYQWQEDQGSGYNNLANGGVYSNATTTTLSITAATSGMDGYKYRCEVDNSECSADQSNEATLTVQTAPSVTADPSDDTICESDNTSFSVTATGTSLTYQWQEDQGSGYGNISNGGVYSDATTATLSITGATSGMDGYKYRCEVGNSECSADQSNEATLTVQTKPSVTADPKDSTICETNDASFSVIATGSSLSYQWQEDQGSGYNNISNGGVYSNATTATLNITGAGSAMDGYKYRCEVDNSECSAIQSNEATFTVQTNPSITANPGNTAICDGGNGSFSVTATGSSLTYQWQEDDGGGFSNISNAGIYSGATTNALTLTSVSSTIDGYDYRCIVDNATCVAVTSSAGTITVKNLPSITSSPADETACVGDDHDFTVAATGTSLTYQWQVDEGSGFGNITNGGFYSGATTTTLSVSSIVTSLDGFEYRCDVVGDCTPSQQSSSATLTVQSPPVVTAHPKDVSICDGDNTSFSITATGTSLTFQWQEDQGTGYSNISNGGVYSNVTTSTLTLTAAPASMVGFSYRCIVDNSACSSVLSNEADISILSPPSVTANASDVVICETEDASFSITATGDGLSYQWQEEDGSGFADISNGGVYSGATTTTLKITAAPASMNANGYRCVVSGTCNPRDTSDTTSLTVDSAPDVTADPTDVQQCEDIDVSFKISATGTSLTFQWQEDQGTGFADISNGGIYGGTTTSTLTVDDIVSAMEGYEYRCVVSGPNCADDISGSALLDVLAKSTVAIPSAVDSSFCEGFGTDLSAAGGIAGDGSTIEWYTGANGTGTNFATGAGPVLVKPNDTTTYFVRREGTCNTTADATILIAVQPKPKAAFTATSTCEGLSTLFLDASTVPDDSISAYRWDLGDASASSKKNVSHLYSSKGTYNVDLIVETKNGCLDTATNTTEIFEQPTANFSVKSVCLGDLSEFVDKSSVGGTATLSYTWDFGDGVGASSLVNPEYEFQSTGGYSIQLKVISSDGCVDSFKRSTNIHQLPEADFDFDDVCLGDDMEFTNKSSIGSGSIKHEWDFDDLGTSTSKSPTHTYATEGGYDVRLISTSNKGCMDTVIQTVEVFELPTAGFTALGACEGSDVSFTNTSTNPTASKMTYEWDFDNGSTSTSSNPQTKYSGSGTYDVMLTVTSLEGCSDDVTTSVDVFSKPAINFAANTVCDGFATSFTNGSTDPDATGLNFLWRFGDGDTSHRISPAHVYPGTGTYSATLVVYTGNGCEDSASIPVNIWPNPKASYRVSNVCEVDSASFINTSNVSSGTFSTLWKFGDLSTSTLENVRHKYLVDGTYNTKVIITSDKGCQDSVGNNLLIHPMPEPNFNFNNQCDGDDVTFVNTTVVTAGTQYGWDFGNGNSTTSESPVFRYLKPGSYNVTLTATTGNGCKETSPAKQVVIHPRVSSRFAFNDVCDNDSVRFINGSLLSAGIATYEWKFGDGSPSVFSRGAKHLYDTFGVYTVTMIANSDQGCTDSVQQLVEVFATPIAQHAIASGCEKEFSSFLNNTVLPTGFRVNYQWDFGDGFTSNLKSPKHQYSTIGNYVSELIAVTNDGCSDTSRQSHNIWPVPEAEFKMFGSTATEVSEVCLLETVNFAELSTIATGKIIDWTWNFGDGSSKIGKTVQKDDYLLAGVYVVTLTVESDSGCFSNTSQKIEILPKPSVDFNFRDTCEGGPVQFNNTSTVDKGQLSFIWDFGDKSKSTLRDPLHTYVEDGEYNIILYGVSTDGCLDTAGPSKIAIHAIPSVEIASNISRFQFCEGDSIVLSVPLDSTHTYAWTFRDTAITTIGDASELTVKRGGTFGIQVTSNKGCSDANTEVLTMWERPTADAGDAATISKGYTTQLDGSGGVLYTWSPDTTFVDNSLIQNPVVSPPEDQKFQLIVADENGCLDTAFVQITVDEDYKLEPADIFTPNDDGTNDVWVIGNIDTYPDCKVIIANRWQQIIYTSDSYTNDWDGTVGGKDLPTGAYSYLIKCGDSKFYTGTVNILR